MGADRACMVFYRVVARSVDVVDGDLTTFAMGITIVAMSVHIVVANCHRHQPCS